MHFKGESDRRARALTGVLLGGFVAGCGTPGTPLTPTLNLPQPITDLAAERHGNAVTTTWTTPSETTDKLPLKGDIRLTLCRKADATTCTPIPGATLSPGAPGSFDDILPPALTAGSPRLLEYMMVAANSRGRSAGGSNTVMVPGGEVPPAITELSAELTKRGVLLHWAPMPQTGEAVTFVLRRELIHGGSHGATLGHGDGQSASPATAASQTNTRLRFLAALGRDPGEVLDKTAADGGTYRYTLQRVERLTVNGNDYALGGFISDPVTVTVRDVFPPEVPKDLAAVTTPAANGQAAAVDLSWAPDPDTDLAGYIVYRRESGGGSAPARISPTTPPLFGPAYHDESVVVGHTYLYSVSAIDRAGNESARSAELQQGLPAGGENQ